MDVQDKGKRICGGGWFDGVEVKVINQENYLDIILQQ